ncbi:MAG: type 2 lantipeptide synthetase LanM [Deltaproteobacteria bacterium]|nr:type 2 lantipeptide synthetase LanM [Deltaproteobacteria bacterium]
MTAVEPPDTHRALDPDDPLPFEHAWLGVLDVAKTSLQHKLQHSCLPLFEEAWIGLERDLLRQLTSISERTIYRVFGRERSSEETLRLLFLGSERSGSLRYDRFVRALRAEALWPLFREFPVLARLTATTVDQWVAASAELIERCSIDSTLLTEMYGAKSPSRAIAKLRPGLSDRHDGGRTVAEVRFDSGLAVVYKPRSLAAEAALDRVLEWSHAIGLDLRSLGSVDRGEYGWQPLVETVGTRDAAETRLYFERAGGLLCLLHALRATDCHRENMIAHGSMPVLVDGETILQPEFAGVEGGLADSDFVGSVVRTGLLPRWFVDAHRRLVMDISALGGSDEDQVEVEAWVFKDVNTDVMCRVPSTKRLPPTPSAVRENGQSVSVSSHVTDLVSGFSAAYRSLMRNRDELIAGPLERLRGVPVRFLFRPTAIYGAVLRKSLVPDHLSDGAAWSAALEALSSVFLDDAVQPVSWPISAAELVALEQQDIPRFVAEADGDELHLPGGGRVKGLLKSGWSDAIARLREMNEADLAFQVAIIRGALHARKARPGEVSEELAGDCVPLARDELITEARSIADRIDGYAHRAADGTRWLGLREIEGGGRFQIAPLDDTLYDGSAGIAVFFASAAKLVDDDVLRARALEAVARLRARVRGSSSAVGASAPGIDREARSSQPPDLAAHGAIGGGQGLGSIIYALSTIGRLLDEPSLAPEVDLAVQLMTDQAIAEDTRFDVIAGAAGAILGLLAAERWRRNGAAIERAIACARSLLDRRVRVRGEVRAWQSAGPALTGFSHGAAGIAFALSRLYELTTDVDFLDAAREAILYERALFDVGQRNWPDLRDPDRPRFAMGWCHGAPGIALARLGMLSAFDDSAIRAELELGVSTTMAFQGGSPDHLCCGSMGRVESLFTVGRTSSLPELELSASRMAAKVVTFARASGSYRLPGAAPESLCPGLFTGIAGIGHQLLRLAAPEIVPSVLLWA